MNKAKEIAGPLKFGDQAQIKALRKIRVMAEAQESWKRIKSESGMEGATRGRRHVQDASVDSDWKCGDCCRVDCESHERYWDKPNGEPTHSPGFDLIYDGDWIKMICEDYLEPSSARSPEKPSGAEA